VGIAAEGAVEDIPNVNPARCTQLHVQTAAMRHKCLFNRERIDLYIAAIVINLSRKARGAIVTADPAGNRYEPDQSEPW